MKISGTGQRSVDTEARNVGAIQLQSGSLVSVVEGLGVSSGISMKTSNKMIKWLLTK